MTSLTFYNRLITGIALYQKSFHFGRQTGRYPLPVSRIRSGFHFRNYAMSNSIENQYDLVIYGATGYTGQFVIEEVARVASLEQKNDNSLKWAVAGRSKKKLLDALESSGKYIGTNLGNVGIIEANNTDPESLSNMATQAKVVINCVGPYYIHGESVIKACIENGSSHVDISGEPQFLELMQLKYDKTAEEAGVHIVGACGYDSVPADVGLCHMIKNFPGELNSAECFMKTKGGRGSSIHTGTLESAALAVANRSKVQEVRRELYPKKLAKPKFRKEKRGVIHKNEDVGMWCLPIPTDEPMVYRTQRYLHEAKGARPVQFQGFLAFRNLFQAVGTLVGVMYFLTLCMFGWTRNLLIKYPEMMTAGVFSRQGAPREALETMSFTSTIVGKGWKQKLSEGSDQYSSPPDSKIIVKITGKDPGYAATSLMMVASAMTILREKSRCERPGGVMTPGIAFMDTGIVDRMIERGMEVTVEKDFK